MFFEESYDAVRTNGDVCSTSTPIDCEGESMSGAHKKQSDCDDCDATTRPVPPEKTDSARAAWNCPPRDMRRFFF